VAFARVSEPETDYIVAAGTVSAIHLGVFIDTLAVIRVTQNDTQRQISITYL
jgi:hypothetical protein